MSKFLQKLLFTVAVLFSLNTTKPARGQSLSANLAIMESKWTLTGTFITPLDKKDKFSLSAVGRYDALYSQENSRNMIIGNVGYAINPSFVALIGTLYSPPLRFYPVIAMQYFWAKKNLSLLLFPNLIFGKSPTLLSFVITEYSRPVNSNINWFLNVQPFIVTGFHNHYSSSLRLRTGLMKGKLQGGLAMDNDFFGNSWEHELHLGIFMQVQFF